MALDDAPRSLGLGEGEGGCGRYDDIIELREHIVGEVERAVLEDVHLAAGRR